MEAEVLDQAFAEELERELRMVHDAIALIGTGVARRVVVANLRYGRAVAEPARTAARKAGLRLAFLPTSDRARVDIAVESHAGIRTSAGERPAQTRRRLGVVRSPA